LQIVLLYTSYKYFIQDTDDKLNWISIYIIVGRRILMIVYTITCKTKLRGRHSTLCPHTNFLWNTNAGCDVRLWGSDFQFLLGGISIYLYPNIDNFILLKKKLGALHLIYLFLQWKWLWSLHLSPRKKSNTRDILGYLLRWNGWIF
jgi:hypothetical protein